MRKPLSIQFSGEAGEGVVTIGDLTVQVLVNLGYRCSLYKSIPSNMRGGYAMSLVRVLNGHGACAYAPFDVLFALGRNALERNRDLLKKGTIVILDSDIADDNNISATVCRMESCGVRIYPVPFSEITRDAAGVRRAKNMAVLGILSFLLGLPEKSVKSQIDIRFRGKDKEVLEKNHRVTSAAFQWAQQNILTREKIKLDRPVSKKNRVLMDGNQAVAMGALAAKCRFFSSYPITPATSIGDYLAELLPANDGAAYQAEDEIAALGAVTGASFVGVKAMTATAGPGLSLMQELIGYASITELPVVVVNVQRGGPSTGMPTKHDQADLFAAVHGGHGEGPRIVLSARDVKDCFYLTVEAFNLSEKYQCPVILLSDSSLSMMKEVIEKPVLRKLKLISRDVLKKGGTDETLRYRVTESGLNPIPVPGRTDGTYCVTGVEHDEDSAPRHTPEIRKNQMAKRFGKLEGVGDGVPHLLEWDLGGLRFGQKADCGVLSWGFSATVSREAVRNLRARGYRIAALYPKLLYPLPKEAIRKLSAFSENVLVPETNYTGQFARLVRMEMDLKPAQFNCSTGEPFYPHDLEAEIEKQMKKKTCKPKRKKS